MGVVLSLFMDLFVRYPKVAGIFGFVLALLFTIPAVLSFQITQRLPNVPERVSISDVAALCPSPNQPQIWVEILDGISDCKSIRYKTVGSDERTQFLVADQNKTTVVVVEYSEHLTCDQILLKNPTGFLSRMDGGRYNQYIKTNEFDLRSYKDTSVFMEMCGFCSLKNSHEGVILGMVFVLIGLSFYPVFLIAHNKRYRKYSG
jgi:hypothetical protein